MNKDLLIIIDNASSKTRNKCVYVCGGFYSFCKNIKVTLPIPSLSLTGPVTGTLEMLLI